MQKIKGFLLFLAIVFMVGCGREENFMNMVKKANTMYDNYISENDISGALFKGPYLNLTINNHMFFEWHSIVPHEGAIVIGVWFDIEGNSGMNSTGLKDNWAYVFNTKNGSINDAVIKNFFNLIDDVDNMIEKESLTLFDRKNIVSFITIKNALIEHYFKKGGYPEDLEALNLGPNKIRDTNGYGFLYAHRDGYIMLGSRGNNKNWDVNDTVIDLMLNNKYDLIKKVEDDLLVKFVPVDFLVKDNTKQ